MKYSGRAQVMLCSTERHRFDKSRDLAAIRAEYRVAPRHCADLGYVCFVIRVNLHTVIENYKYHTVPIYLSPKLKNTATK